MTTQPDLAELRALLARCTALPITARPQEYDDWGTIRSVERGDDGFQRVFARVQIHASLEEQNEHRAAKTDPTQDTMDLIVAAMNALPWLLDRAAVGGDNQEVGLREAAWLVEFPESGDSYHGGKRVGPATPVQWYCGLPVRSDEVCTRTTNPNEAIRFARKCDAEAVILLLENESQWKGHGRIGAFVSEHVWIAALCESAKAVGGASDWLVLGPVWREEEEESECWTAEVQVVGGHEVMATVHGGSEAEATARAHTIIAALTRPEPAKAVEGEAERLAQCAKANNTLARMNGAHRDEWREKAAVYAEALDAVREHFDGERRDKDWAETERLVRAALQRPNTSGENA